MRSADYYLLIPDATRNDLESIEDSELGEFDLLGLMCGERCNLTKLKTVTLTMSEGNHADLVEVMLPIVLGSVLKQ